MSIKQKALQWMLDTAADQSHGYSQQNRWSPDYDCSSAVITAWQTAGVPVKTMGATYTGNMKSVFLKCGFKDVTKQCNLSTCVGMEPSDVLLNEIHHTAMYCGGGQIVHARGQSYGSPATGDQGAEFAVTGYYNYPWDCVLRYAGGASGASGGTPSAPGKVGLCSVNLGEFVGGCIDPEIKTIQVILNAKGYKGKNGKKLTVDGELGENTMYAITKLQKKAGMKNINFGTVSSKTWKAIIDLWT